MYYTEKSLSILEFDKIRHMLAECAFTEGGAVLAEKILPSSEIEEVISRQRKTADARRLVDTKGYPPFGGIKNIGDSVERANKGATLSTRELLDIAAVLKCTRLMLDYIKANKLFETCIDEMFERLMPHRNLEESIMRSIISEDMIADEASSELADIRRKIRAVNNKIKDSLQKFVSGNVSKFLQEKIVTQRNGRYVIPVKQEYRGDVKGLIHDTSASGATLFIEPVSVLEANNELMALESREQHEIERILSELSARCGDYSNELLLNYENITRLSLIFACASLAIQMNAISPKIVEGRSVDLRRARHPLIPKDTVVPIDVYLGETFDSLVITGPNTGGKTVTLKTIGLFVLMTQAGLQIPVDEESSLGVFSGVFPDIGDEQSIEQSLSTFSSHMVNIVNILNRIDDKSLVLFDELGAGTDPIEGAALAISILEHVRSRGALTAATTHYAELKAYAIENDRVCNASCEFDVETLRPTYKLVIGTPGKSNAFAISQKLGLNDAIVKDAKNRISSDERKFESVIEQLELNRQKAEENKEESIRLRREYEKFKKEAENRITEKEAKLNSEIKKAEEKARQLIEGARASSEYILKQLEAVRKKQEKENFAQELLAAKHNIKTALKDSSKYYDITSTDEDDDYELPRNLVIGDNVFIPELGQKGVVVSLPDSKGNVNVQAGILKTKVQLSKLRLLDEQSEKESKESFEKKKTAESKIRVSIARDFKPEVDVRGMIGDDAWFIVDKYLDDAMLLGILTVRIIHGKGTGALRAAIQRFLKGDRRILSYRTGTYGEGDGGVTVVELKKK